MSTKNSEIPQEPGLPADEPTTTVGHVPAQGGAGMMEPDSPIGFTADVGGEPQTTEQSVGGVAAAASAQASARADAAKERT